jgi:hypothetical protein
MKTKEYIFKGPNDKSISIVAPADIGFPFDNPIDYPDCCGAGQGIGEKIVPETIWGVRVSLACFIHDDMWNRGEKSWSNFHQSNSIFLKNIISIIQAYSKSQLLKRLRLYRAVTYYNAVDDLGRDIFWELED